MNHFLFARPTFLLGMAQTSDLWGHLVFYNQSATEALADARAMYSDWRVVGEDIVCAMVAERQHREQKDSGPVGQE